MKISINSKNIISLIIYLIIGLYSILQMINITDESLIINYMMLIIAYFICGGIFIFMYIKKKFNIFEPYVIVSLLYFCILIFYPMYDICRNYLTKVGVDTSGGCVKATIIFILAYIFFTLGYWLKIKVKINHAKIKNNKSIFDKINIVPDSTISLISLIWWVIATIAALYGQISRGYSLAYIFSFGQSSMEDVTYRGGLLFLTNFGTTMLMAYMLYLAYGKNKLLKIAMTMITLIYLFMRNSRWILMIFMCGPIIYYYIKNKKTPNLKFLVAGGLILLSVLSFIQINRYNLATGGSLITENIFLIENLLLPFESDFSTYKTFYGIVEAIPKDLNYLYGETMISYTVSMIIPRVIWANKPTSPLYIIVEAALNELAVAQGVAFPNIGEYYSNFGIIGTFICMFIFGILIAKSKNLLKYNSKCALVLFSCFYPFCFQLTCRDLCSSVYTILFAMIPIITIYIYSINRKVVGIHGKL